MITPQRPVTELQRLAAFPTRRRAALGGLGAGTTSGGGEAPAGYPARIGDGSRGSGVETGAAEALWAIQRHAADTDQREQPPRRLAMHGPQDEVATAARQLARPRTSEPLGGRSHRRLAIADNPSGIARPGDRTIADQCGASPPAVGVPRDASLPLAAVANLAFETCLDTAPFLGATDPFVFATVVDLVSRDFSDLAGLRTCLARANQPGEDAFSPAPAARLAAGDAAA